MKKSFFIITWSLIIVLMIIGGLSMFNAIYSKSFYHIVVFIIIFIFSFGASAYLSIELDLIKIKEKLKEVNKK